MKFIRCWMSRLVIFGSKNKIGGDFLFSSTDRYVEKYGQILKTYILINSTFQN